MGCCAVMTEVSARVCVSVVATCLLATQAGTAPSPSPDKSAGGGGFKPRDVKSGEYPDYDKYVDLPDESLQQTLWHRVLRDPKTRRPTKPMTKRRARMMRWRKRYLKEREERYAEEERLAKLSTEPPHDLDLFPPTTDASRAERSEGDHSSTS